MVKCKGKTVFGHKCGNLATGYYKTKPYCKSCYQRRIYKNKLKRLREKSNNRVKKGGLKQENGKRLD